MCSTCDEVHLIKLTKLCLPLVGDQRKHKKIHLKVILKVYMLNLVFLLEKDNGDLQNVLITFLDHKRRFSITLRCLLTATKTRATWLTFWQTHSSI